MVHYAHFAKLKGLKAVIPYGATRINGLVSTGIWEEGVHFIKDLSGDRLYNVPVIQNWLINQTAPEAHRQFVDAYLQSKTSHKLQLKGGTE
jgi:hypothetical protein